MNCLFTASRPKRLPWNETTVHVVEGVRERLAAGLASGLDVYLPASISLYADLDVEPERVERFVENCGEYLKREIPNRLARRDAMVSQGLVGEEEIEEILTWRTHVQPWAIYYSSDGGLRLDEEPLLTAESRRGIVPCSTMRNHGVAWRSGESGEPDVWLVTARKLGQDWDWDSDIGHESAHAAFAPVPLFVQPHQLDITKTNLAYVSRAADLEPSHVARMCYLFSEIGVVAVRDESRPTRTRLPVEDPSELESLYGLADELLPGAGFDVRVDARDVFRLAAPVLRLLPRLSGYANRLHPPTAADLRAAAQR